MDEGLVTDLPSEIEGLDSNFNSGWADYPLDSVFVRKEERTVGEVIKRVKNNRYQLDPEFQRSFVWNTEKQSKLIESCIMRIPLPVFYVAEAKDGRIVVVDGLQRITTLFRFLENQFVLKGMGERGGTAANPLEGLRFKDLPINLRERIEDTQLIFYILDSKAPERARLDIFDRVNSGVPLSRQQMRNSLYSGSATQWLKMAANLSSFKTATGNSLDKNTMRDREAINRFAAFKLLGYQSYQNGDMDGFLGKALDRLNKMSSSDLETLRVDFEDSMQWNNMLFGRHAFRKSIREMSSTGRRSVINIALWDVTSVFFSNYVLNEVDDDFNETVVNAVSGLLNDDDFSISVTFSTNSTLSVSTRFEMFSEALDNLF